MDDLRTYLTLTMSNELKNLVASKLKFVKFDHECLQTLLDANKPSILIDYSKEKHQFIAKIMSLQYLVLGKKFFIFLREKSVREEMLRLWDEPQGEEELFLEALFNLTTIKTINSDNKEINKSFGPTKQIELNCMGSLSVIESSFQTLLLAKVGEIKLFLSISF
jgi:hypothetical protein